MLELHEIDNWLNTVNARYRADQVPPHQRPFRAMSDYSLEHNCTFSLDSPIAKAIIEWFDIHSQPGSQAIGAMFTGAFFFDACFWPLNIPIGYGKFSINAVECLESMPKSLKDQLLQSHHDQWNLALYWVDCCDYAYGINEIINKGNLKAKALRFLQNADRELAGAIAQLVIPRPNLKAILALRMACEIFLKVLLIQEQDLSDKELKKIGHEIKDIADKCFALTKTQDFDSVSKAIGAYPEVSDRYDGVEREMTDVWKALCVTQIAATAVIRQYTGRDMRKQVLSSLQKNS